MFESPLTPPQPPPIKPSITAEDMGPAPSPAHGFAMQIVGVKRSESIHTVVGRVLPQVHSENVVRRARLNMELSPGSIERLETEATLTVFGDDRLAWDVKYAALREAVLNAAMTRLNYYQRELERIPLGKANSPVELTYVRYVLGLVQFRLHKLTEVPAEKLKYLRLARVQADALSAAARRAGPGVSPMFASIAAVNQVAMDWQIAYLIGPPPSVEMLIDLCRRGKAATTDAANKFEFWTSARRDQIEYTSMLLRLAPSSELRAELNEQLRQLAKAFTGSFIDDVLLLLRLNMEPTARVAIKDCAVYKRLQSAAVNRGESKMPKRITLELLAELKTVALGDIK